MTSIAWRAAVAAGLGLACVAPGSAELDTDAIVQAYRQYDLGFRGGRGYSEETDSGNLGWGESQFLRAYADLWLATGDAAWLAKIEDHFTRIVASARDHDGDGFVGWQTTAYSVALFRTQRLHNVSDAAISPESARVTDAKEARRVIGHTYVISFPEAGRFEVIDRDAGLTVVASGTYVSGEAITDIPGCRVSISGAARAGDAFVVLTTAPEPEEYVVHEGMMLYPVAIFMQAAYSAPGLLSQFGSAADRFMDFINRHIVHKHEREWLDMGEGIGAYRFPPVLTDRYPNRILPHNQYLALARAYLVLKDLPGADPLMATRAEAMARYFRANLRENGAGWVWNYWDWVEYGQPGASGPEDTSHGAIDIGFAIEAQRRGVVFTEDDLRRFARTWLDSVWNGDTGNPRLGPNCATRGEDYSAAHGDWVGLCRWEPEILTLAQVAFEKEGRPARLGPALLAAAKLLAP